MQTDEEPPDETGIGHIVCYAVLLIAFFPVSRYNLNIISSVRRMNMELLFHTWRFQTYIYSCGLWRGRR